MDKNRLLHSMQMHSWLHLCLLFCCLSLSSARPLSLHAAPLRQAQVMLHIHNEVEQPICAVYISATTASDWGENRLGDDTIAPGATYTFPLAPGDYDLLLQDCNDNSLFNQRNLTIKYDYKFLLTQSAVSNLVCDTHNEQGIQAYNRAHYGEALRSFQHALACYRTTGNQIGEGRTLNNIGALSAAEGRYTEALEAYEQALVIRRRVGDRRDEGTTLNNMAGVYNNQGRYAEALAAYQQALTLLQTMDDGAGKGAALNGMGEVYRAQGRYAEALAHYEQALTLAQAAMDQVSEGTTLNNIGLVYDAQGRYAEALVHYEQALTLAQAVGDQAGERKTLNNIGAVYNAQGHYSQAMAHYEQALALVRESSDRDTESATLNGMGEVYRAQGRYGEALALYQQALTIVQTVGNRTSESFVLNNIGLVHRAQGRYAEALAYYEQALAIQQVLGNQAGEGTTLNNIGLVYDNQGRYPEALDYYEQAPAIRRTVGDAVGEGVTLNNIGLLYDNQGRYTEALGYYEPALAIRQALGDLAGEGIMLNNIGLVYDNQGRNAEALDYYEQALTILRVLDNQTGEGTILNNLGGIFYSQGRYTEALDYYEQALMLVHELGDLRSEGTTLNNIAMVYQTQARYAEALHYYSSGIDLLESIRSTAGNDQARTSFVNRYTAAYDRVIALELEQGALDLAFRYSERGRARTLLDLLTTGQVDLFDNAAADLLARENEAYAMRQATQAALASAKALTPPDPTLVADLEAQLAATETAYAAALSAIQARQDGLADLVPGRTQNVLSVDAVQKQLDPQTTLVSYWLLKDKTIAFLITANAFTVVELPDATMDTIATAVVSFYQWHNRENPHPRPLRILYQWLVAPLAEHLHTPQVVIVPHQWLHYVPFAALTDGEHYFGEQHTLSLLPSASVLPFLAQNAARAQANASTQALVFGNPQSALPSLPAATAEAQAVADLLATTVYTAAQASEVRLRATLTGTAILHLAAHGEYNLANPLYSALHLTAAGSDDGRLETHEIFGLALRTNRLVILSACQTNLNELTDTSQVAVSRGDEIVSLTRAFFFAGAPTVISSLWNVDDAATETLMVAFYRHWLEEGMSKAAALQAAQADVRANPRWVSPFYWAGFVLNGDPGVAR